jgi:hypothetical protein
MRFRHYEGESWGKILARRTKLDPSKVDTLEERLAEGVKQFALKSVMSAE